MIHATVICDASFDSNNVHRPAGWAAWVRVDGYPNPIKGWGSIKYKCQNSTDAEAYAALNGIWLACSRGAAHVLVRSDCQTIDHLIRGTCQSQRLIKLWADGLATVAATHGRPVLRSEWVKAHGDKNRHRAAWVNDWADKKARAGMRAQRSGSPFVTMDP